MSHETPTILLAEDSTAIRSILAFLLRGRGYTVLECGDGQEALERARTDHPDAVILDVMMPGPTGFDVCQALKTDPATRGIPIMILTAVTHGTGKPDEHWKTLSGADDFMTKPFKAADILHRIARMIKTAGGHGAPPVPKASDH
jgi:CheY-like chemotaxis protein